MHCYLLFFVLTKCIKRHYEKLEVLGIPHSLFEEKLEKLKNAKGVELDTDLTASDLKELVEQYKDVYLETKGDNFPSGTNNFFLFRSIVWKRIC